MCLTSLPPRVPLALLPLPLIPLAAAGGRWLPLRAVAVVAAQLGS
jgi:hypothetical protein